MLNYKKYSPFVKSVAVVIDYMINLCARDDTIFLTSTPGMSDFVELPGATNM